jgi:hypothetical protein
MPGGGAAVKRSHVDGTVAFDPADGNKNQTAIRCKSQLTGSGIEEALMDGEQCSHVKTGQQARCHLGDITEPPIHTLSSTFAETDCVAGRAAKGPRHRSADPGQRGDLSFHRLQIKGAHKSGILLYPRHTWKNYLKYRERNERFDVAAKPPLIVATPRSPRSRAVHRVSDNGRSSPPADPRRFLAISHSGSLFTHPKTSAFAGDRRSRHFEGFADIQ